MADDKSKYPESMINQEKIDTLLFEAEGLGENLFNESSGNTTGNKPDTITMDAIDQDEIDKLLNSQSDPEDDEEEEDDLDFISEDDIARLLNAEDSTPKKSNDELSSISDEDLDSLMNSESLDAAPTAASDSGDSLISQDDIDAILNQLPDKAPAKEEAPGEEDSLISQDDIDKLLNQSTTSDNDRLSGDGDEEDSLISQDDIDSLLSNVAGEIDVNESDDSISDEEDEESLISQDDIDNLLSQAAGETDEVPDEEDDEESLISQDDIDNLLNQATSEPAEEQTDDYEEEESIISQDDIDNLLKQASENEKAEDIPEEKPMEADSDAVVSQEDIDNLLQSADKNDDEEVETIKLVSQKDIDNLLTDEDEEDEEDKDTAIQDSQDKVILEEERPDTTVNVKKPWYKSKLLIGCVGTLVIFLITGALFILTGKKNKDPKTEMQTELAETMQEVKETADNLAETMEQPLVSKNITTSVMNGFIVTAPVKVEKIAFIAVDLSIDFIDVSTDPIKDYEPFFRNIIYEVLKKALVLESELQVNEADLKKMIIEALNDALAEGAVDNVNFTSFKLS